jgi:small subunit ribosomal protein S15
MLDKVKKTNVIKDFGLHAKDTGSAEVQVAVLTERINYLHKHFAAFPKDVASKRGLLNLVSRRRSFLSYLKRTDVGKYEAVIARLGLRK